MLLGGIEAGGTKMVCAVGDEKGNIIERFQIPTTVDRKRFDLSWSNLFLLDRYTFFSIYSSKVALR